MLITAAQSITFFRTEAAAKAMAERNGGEAEGFFVEPARRNPNEYVIAVREGGCDGYALGYL